MQLQMMRPGGHCSGALQLLLAALLCASALAVKEAVRLAIATPDVRKGLVPLTTGSNSKNMDWRIINVGNGGDNIRHFVNYTAKPPVLAVRYPKGSAYPSCSRSAGCTPGGITFYASPLSVFPAQEARLTYQLAFASNFVPVKGGKLPGLFIGNCVSSSSCVSGASGGIHGNTASVRVVFRPTFPSSKAMTAEAYVYVPSLDKQSTAFCKAAGQPLSSCGRPNKAIYSSYGWDLWRGDYTWAEPRGPTTWNNVTVHVRMNTIGANGMPNRDGFLLLSINGVTRSINSIVWRTSPAFSVNSLFFETFFGGSDKTWATPVDTLTYYRNIRIEKLKQVETQEDVVTAAPNVTQGLMPLSTYTSTKNMDWRILNVGNGGDNTRHYINTTVRPPVLAVKYPKGSAYPSCSSTDGCTPGGITFYASPLSVFPAQEARLTYQLAFASNFVPVKGGKLPGLFIGDCVDSSACVSGASGGVHGDTSSVRVMFRPASTGSTAMTAEAYVYVPSLDKQSTDFCLAAAQPASSCGNPNKAIVDSYGWDLWRFNYTWLEPRGPDAWNNVTLQVRMNTIAPNGTPNRDGYLLLSINSISRSISNMVWRTNSLYGINALFFETFFGGSDKTWATPVDTYTYYRNLRIEKIGTDTTSQPSPSPVPSPSPLPSPSAVPSPSPVPSPSVPPSPSPVKPSPTPSPSPLIAPSPAPAPSPSPPTSKAAAIATPDVAKGLVPLTTYTNSKNLDWRIINVGNGGDNSRHSIDTSVQPPLLAVKYPNGSAYPSCSSSSGCTPGGITFYASPLSVFPAQEARLTYQLAFASNFVPVKGGKLPGLFVGSCVNASSCVASTSGKSTGNTAHVRVAFLPASAGSTAMTAEAYVYAPSLDKQSAEFCSAVGQPVSSCAKPVNTIYDSKIWQLWRGNYTWAEPRGRTTWNNVTVHVRMNTMAADGVTPNRDGFLLLAINGVTRSIGSMVWRTSAAFGVNSLYFETYFGGSDKTSATPVDTFTFYRNIRIEKLSNTQRRGTRKP